jgi:hypothetical protein
MNKLGKTLVLVNLVFSVLLLSWAVALFFQPVDWGWQEPRKVYGAGGETKDNERLASRIDERLAAYPRYVEAAQLALASLKPAQEALDETQKHLGFNRRLHRAELARLERPGLPADQVALAAMLSPDVKQPAKFEPVRAVKYSPNGLLALAGDRPWGWPILDKVVEVEVFTAAGKPQKLKIDRPFSEYLTDLGKTIQAVEDVSLRLTGKDGLLEKLQKQTVWLNGRHDDKGQLIEPGVYQLLDMETAHQRKLREELDHLQPLWVRELYNAQLLRARRESLEQRLRELGVNPSEVIGE